MNVDEAVRLIQVQQHTTVEHLRTTAKLGDYTSRILMSIHIIPFSLAVAESMAVPLFGGFPLASALIAPMKERKPAPR